MQRTTILLMSHRRMTLIDQLSILVLICSRKFCRSLQGLFFFAIAFVLIQESLRKVSCLYYNPVWFRFSLFTFTMIECLSLRIANFGGHFFRGLILIIMLWIDQRALRYMPLRRLNTIDFNIIIGHLIIQILYLQA